MIKNIIFDIGNVLTDFAWEPFYRSFGYAEEIYERLVKATIGTQAWHEFDRGEWSDEKVFDAFVQNDPGIEKEIREVTENMHGIVTKRDFAIEWIQELKSKGYQVYVLSNFSKKIETECADALDFLPYTDGGILSYRDKVIKPDPVIYHLLMERYGLIPEECVFLDDLERNIIAARKCGMHGIIFTSKEKAEKELRELGVV